MVTDVLGNEAEVVAADILTGGREAIAATIVHRNIEPALARQSLGDQSDPFGLVGESLFGVPRKSRKLSFDEINIPPIWRGNRREARW